MKILIGHNGTKLFVQDHNQWTPDRHAARDFMQSSDAMEFISQHRLEGVEIVLSFPNEGYEIRIASPVAYADKNSRQLTGSKPSFRVR